MFCVTKKIFPRSISVENPLETDVLFCFTERMVCPTAEKLFLASKKVGKSVVRNRARRLMKESYRSLEEQIPAGYDMIFIARTTICDLKCADVKKSIEAALKRSGILSKSPKQNGKVTC